MVCWEQDRATRGVVQMREHEPAPRRRGGAASDTMKEGDPVPALSNTSGT
jgi:hypothetical protein